MNQLEIRSYVESYFRAFQSRFHENNPAYFSVELPIEVDKDLGNRPFYWTYVEKIGMQPNPLTLTFVFDRDGLPEGARGEELPFGSRRLHQIFDSAKKHGKFVRLYEANSNASPSSFSKSESLIPWLGINYKIEFICDQKKDIIYPLGINLVSGQIMEEFYHHVKNLPLTPKLPDYSFTMQPIFGIESATARLEQHVQSRIDQEDTLWAEEAKRRLEEEKELVESFYQEEYIRQSSSESDEEAWTERKNKWEAEKLTRLQELNWQFEPRIEVSMINAGLFYLRNPILH